MCVVNKKGLIFSKTETSKDPIMVKRIITAIVETIGPIEFSANAEKQIDKEDTVSNDKKATIKLKPYLHKISCSGRITKPSLVSTIRSPVPNITFATKRAKKTSHKVRINV